jgi:hypothetical protein
MRRHPWLPGMIAARPTLGPNGVALLQYVLVVLEEHPARLSAKLEAFAKLMAVTAAFVQAELALGSGIRARSTGYLQYAIASGEYPRLTHLLQAGSHTRRSRSPVRGDPGPCPFRPARVVPLAG